MPDTIRHRNAAGRIRTVVVPDWVGAEWRRLCNSQGTDRPVGATGYRLAPYPEVNVASHRPYASDGIYTDHTDPTMAARLFDDRDRLGSTDNQDVLQTLAERYGLRHWRDAYNTARNEGRRRTGENGRDAATGTLRWRRWNNGWSPAALARATRVAAASGSRCFGVELEWNHPYGGTSGDGSACHNIAADARRQGLAFTEFWSSYGSTDHNGRRRAAGWLGTYDSTVTGGEIISDIMGGDDASLAEVRDMLAIIRRHGGEPGARQGTHVHHDARDFSTADKVRLVDNLRVAAPILESYLPASRRNGYWCGTMDDYAWDTVRQCVAAGRSPGNNHGQAYNLGHLFESSARVEFRAFGHSLNSTKLRVWIRVGQAIMAATKAGTVFAGIATAPALTTLLRQHGLSQSAADRFCDTVANRAAGRRVARV